MVGRRIVVVFTAVAGLSACSLFVSLDGLSTSSAVDSAPGGDAGPEASSDARPSTDGGFGSVGDGATSSAYAAAILADSPVGYWRFDDISGPTVRDEIGNAHPGTIYGGVQLGVPGAEGTAFTFDGNKGCIDVGPNFLFAAPAPFSVEVWVKPVDFAAYKFLVSTETNIPSGLRDGWSIAVASTGQASLEAWSSVTDASAFIIGAYSQNTPGSAPPLLLNTWTQIDTTYDGNGVGEIWFDGVLRDHATEPGGLRGDRGALSFGCRGATTPTPVGSFNGSIDEISIFDKVLTREQILAHKAAHLAK